MLRRKKKLGHPRRNGQRTKPLQKCIEKIVSNRPERRPAHGNTALKRPNGNRIVIEELTLQDGRKVERFGDLPVCPSCGYDLQQKITDADYTNIHFEAVRRVRTVFKCGATGPAGCLVDCSDQ